MNGHEGDSLLVKLLQIFISFEHLSPGVKELNNFLGLINIVTLQKQGNNPMWRTFGKWEHLGNSFFFIFGNYVSIDNNT
jgi:hypothetical protein